MANIFGDPKKNTIRARLFKAAILSLEQKGWKVERVVGLGKGSVRRISKGMEKKLVSIRTTQDTWIAFPRNPDDASWATLADVDYVVAASVDNPEKPKFARIHLIAADEIRQRFDRAYAARKAAGHVLPIGRGVWVSLYGEDSPNPVNRVGAGAGTTENEIGTVTLEHWIGDPNVAGDDLPPTTVNPADVEYLTIAEAKRRLAFSLGVSETEIRITISS